MEPTPVTVETLLEIEDEFGHTLRLIKLSDQPNNPVLIADDQDELGCAVAVFLDYVDCRSLRDALDERVHEYELRRL